MSSLRSFCARGPADTFAPWFMAAVLAGGVYVLADDGCAANAQVPAARMDASAATRSSGSATPQPAHGEGPESDEAAMRESRKATLPASEIAGPLGLSRSEHRQRMQLALELAVVCVNEGSFENLAECALVYQVAEARAQTVAGRRDFLRSHSPRALGLKTCHGGNCLWSPDLLIAPHRAPAMFDPAWWDAARDHRWREVLRYARGLVFGIEEWRPCDQAPWSWGYAGDLDGAFERGLRPLGCSGVDQDGFVLAAARPRAAAPKVISAQKARGHR